KQSLEELGPIILTLKEVKGDSISERREIGSEVGEKLATKWGTGFIETSAKTNENLEFAFLTRNLRYAIVDLPDGFS
uniref:Uncharacterized protein n=1 Tax=Parascaris equorum TaxID=6256 RepID=A0A914SI42_PAREQ